jgi:hypothetical protein
VSTGDFGEGGAWPEKEKKTKEPKAKPAWDAANALFQLAGQAFASASSIKELGRNFEQAGGQFLGQLGSNLAGGGGIGSLVGGMLQFGWNMAFGHDEKLPIHDNALNSRIVNWTDMVLAMTAVRDRSELSYAKSYNESWRLAGARGA